MDFSSKLRNFDSPIFRGHHLPFPIPYYQPNQITPRLHIKTCLQSYPRTQLALERCIFPPHSKIFLYALDKNSIAIEECSHDRQFICVAAIYLTVANAPYVHMGE